MKWGIECYRDAPIDETFVHGLFYRLVAEGARYNAAKYPGSFFISGNCHDEVFEEEEIEDRTHKISNIITKYGSFDTSKTSLTVNLNYIGDAEFYFSVGIRPNSNATVVDIQTTTNEIQSDEEFMTVVTLCKRVIESFEFTHCRYTNENRGGLEFDSESFIENPG